MKQDIMGESYEMDFLEDLVDRCGVEQVVAALSCLCQTRAEQPDNPDAESWDKVAGILITCDCKLTALGEPV